MSRKAFYAFAAVMCLAGWIWTGCAMAGLELEVCLFKCVTGIPCPACGSTRTVLDVLKGDWAAALSGNPMGFLLVPGLMVLPVWLVADWLRNSASLYRCYMKCNLMLNGRISFGIFVLLVLVDWALVVYRGL